MTAPPPAEEGTAFQPIPAGAEHFDDAKPLSGLDRERADDLKKDRELRERFMSWMIWILIGQLAVVNGGLIALAGLDRIEVEEWTLRTWIAGTLLEVFGIVLVIAKYLFPKRPNNG